MLDTSCDKKAEVSSSRERFLGKFPVSEFESSSLRLSEARCKTRYKRLDFEGVGQTGEVDSELRHITNLQDFDSALLPINADPLTRDEPVSSIGDIHHGWDAVLTGNNRAVGELTAHFSDQSANSR